jgi:hypothetical protein
MKALKIIRFIILFAIILYSCRNKSQIIENNELTYVYVDSLTNENLITKNKEQHRFIKLETTAGGLVSAIEKMDFDDGKIFFKDSNKKVFVFNEQGKFLNTIGQIGPGPDEHYSIYDFYLDKKNKQVCIFDIYKSAIYSYTYSGKIVKKKNIYEPNFKNISSIHLVNDNTLLLTKDNSHESKYNFCLVRGNSYSDLCCFIPFLLTGEMPLSFRLSHKVSQYRSNTFISAFISDTIYKYDAVKNSIVADMVFWGKHRSMTAKDVTGKELRTGMDALAIAREKNLSYGLSLLVMTKKHMHFTFETRDDVKRVFWDLETRKGRISEIINDSQINNYFTYLISSTEDAFVCAIPAYIFIEADWTENESARIAAQNTDEEDNPIIAFYYID